MATVVPTINRDVSPTGDCILVTWAGVNGGDTCVPFRADRFGGDITAQIYGSVLTTITLSGSNDVDGATNYSGMKDWGGAAIAGAGIFNAREHPLWVKPTATTATNATFAVMFRRVSAGVVG